LISLFNHLVDFDDVCYLFMLANLSVSSLYLSFWLFYGCDFISLGLSTVPSPMTSHALALDCHCVWANLKCTRVYPGFLVRNKKGVPK